MPTMPNLPAEAEPQHTQSCCANPQGTEGKEEQSVPCLCHLTSMESSTSPKAHSALIQLQADQESAPGCFFEPNKIS